MNARRDGRVTRATCAVQFSSCPSSAVNAALQTVLLTSTPLSNLNLFASHRREAEYCDCDERAYAFVCLSVCIPQDWNCTSKLQNVLCVLPVVVTRSFSGGIAMCYALLGLRMTSCFEMCVNTTD